MSTQDWMPAPPTDEPEVIHQVEQETTETDPLQTGETVQDANRREEVESWAVPSHLGAQAARESRQELEDSQDYKAQEMLDRAADKRAGLSEADSDFLEGPPQTTKDLSILERLPSVNDAGEVDESTRWQSNESIQTEQAAKQNAVDEAGEQSLDLYHRALEQTTALDEYGTGGLDDQIDEKLIEFDRDETAESLRADIGKSAELYSVSHPEFAHKVEGAKYTFAKQRASEYQAAGHSAEVSMKQAAADSEFEIYRATSEANRMGHDVAQYLDHVASQFLAGQAGQQQGQGAAIAAAVTAGQRAAKTTGKGGGGRGAGKPTSQQISEIEDPEEHSRAYAAWVRENS